MGQAEGGVASSSGEDVFRRRGWKQAGENNASTDPRPWLQVTAPGREAHDAHTLAGKEPKQPFLRVRRYSGRCHGPQRPGLRGADGDHRSRPLPGP